MGCERYNLNYIHKLIDFVIPAGKRPVLSITHNNANMSQHEVLRTSHATLGDEHPDTLASMNNLAVVLKDQGKFAEAKVGEFDRQGGRVSESVGE